MIVWGILDQFWLLSLHSSLNSLFINKVSGARERRENCQSNLEGGKRNRSQVLELEDFLRIFYIVRCAGCKCPFNYLPNTFLFPCSSVARPFTRLLSNKLTNWEIVCWYCFIAEWFNEFIYLRNPLSNELKLFFLSFFFYQFDKGHQLSTIGN